MDCQERLVQQAQQTKAANPKTKVWVYRNLVKALPWFTDVRVKINDPQYVVSLFRTWITTCFVFF